MTATVEGHTLKIFLRPRYKENWIECSCGWGTSQRKTVMSIPGTDRTKTRNESIKDMRARGDEHLYEAWRAARQQRLDV